MVFATSFYPVWMGAYVVSQFEIRRSKKVERFCFHVEKHIVRRNLKGCPLHISRVYVLMITIDDDKEKHDIQVELNPTDFFPSFFCPETLSLKTTLLTPNESLRLSKDVYFSKIGFR